MGTDIHLEVEVRDPATGRWWPAKPRHVIEECHCTWRARDERGAPDPKCFFCSGAGKHEARYYHHRNYDAFAILADVRNGTGFAGCDTGDGFIPISPPRGLPADLSPELRDADFGDHSESHVTLAELLAVDRKATTKHRGWTNAEGFARFRESGRPSDYCGGVSGPGVRHISNAEMENLIAAGSDTTDCYTQVEWAETYGEAAADLFRMADEKLVPLIPENGYPGDVRLVFGFDS